MAYVVPQVPGVPPLTGGFASVASFGFPAVSGAIVDISNSLPGSLGPQWGIFLNGAPVVTADVVVAQDFREEWVIADYPIENGGFESYDKVWRPFDVRMTFVSGESVQNRAALIDSIAAIAGDMNLYDFVTPEVIYQSVSIAHDDYHRETTRGAGALPVSVWGWQISINTTSGLTNAANSAPGGNDPSFVGPTQATDLGAPAYGVSPTNATSGSQVGTSLGIPQIAGPASYPATTNGVTNAPYNSVSGAYSP